MANIDTNFNGLTKLRDWWSVVKQNFININTQLVNHIAGTADKHAAQDVTYSGNATGSTVKEAIDNTDARIDNLVITGTTHDPFVTDSLIDAEGENFGPAPGNETYLNGRLTKWENKTISHLTETVQRQDDPHGVYTEIFVRGVNPKWFGAVGDGIVDDTVALQNAINATPVNGILYAPDKYLITDTLYFNKDILYTGKGTIIKGFDTTSPMIRFYRGQIRDLIFIGNGNTQGHCINLQNNADGTKMEISNCIFLNIPGSAILGSSEETTVSINCNIHDNYIYNCGSGSAAVSPFTSAIRIANMSKIKVINNRINGNGNTYKGIDFSVGGSYCDISHNIVENCRYIGIGIAGQRYFKVNNNIVSTTVDNCIDINGCLYGTVNNNVIEAGKDGIFIGHNGVDNINVTGNEIQGCQQGIRIWDGAKNVLISSNKINNCSNQGIRASGTDGTTENLLNNIAIVDNMIQFATAAVGILIEGCYNIHCNNNSIKRITKGIDIKIITSSIYYGNVSHNTLLECSEYGINVGAGVNRLLLATNMIYGVSGNIYAINFAGSNSKLYYNMLEGTNNTINNTGVNNTVL